MTYRQYDTEMFTCYMGKLNMQEILKCFVLYLPNFHLLMKT